MQNLTTLQNTTDASLVSRRHFPIALALTVLFLAVLWFVLCRELSGEWLVNQQYSFGWFVPFFALYLFWLRWQDAPPARIPNLLQRTRSDGQAFQSQISNSMALAIAIAALLLLLPVRLFEIANPEWRPLAWIHAAAAVTLTLLLIWGMGGGAWVRHFAFPVAFIFVAVPWVTALEVPVIQGLMRTVARVAAETVMLLGIPAQVEGNLIRVGNGLVGVNEACSGIRSLQTSLMIGLLIGELKRFSISRRVALIAGAVAIALIANFLRAVFLVVIAATKNISEISRWHDVAGYTIIALVFLGTMGLAYLLGKSEVRSQKSEVGKQEVQSAAEPMGSATQKAKSRQVAASELGNERVSIRNEFTRRGGQSAIASYYLVFAFCWLLFIEIGTAAWYRLHETNLVTSTRWSVRWPERALNFRELKIDEEIRSVLRFDEGQAAAWTITSSLASAGFPLVNGSATPMNQLRQNTIAGFLYVFRWKPGRNSALLANLHRPDVCLPASGWTQLVDDGVRNYPVSGPFELPFRHFEFQRAFENSTPQTAHAFYCLSEDRAAGSSAPPSGANLPSMSGSRSEWTRSERLRTVLEGRRHLGQQVIEAIFIGDAGYSAAEAESHLRDLVREVVVSREAEK